MSQPIGCGGAFRTTGMTRTSVWLELSKEPVPAQSLTYFSAGRPVGTATREIVTMQELKTTRYLNPALLNAPCQEVTDRRIAEMLAFEETDRSRGLIIVGMVFLMLGLLLANFGALQALTAVSHEQVAGQPLLRLLPVADDPVIKWIVFGVTSVLMAAGLTMIGSQGYHPSLLALHVVVPASVIPLAFGYLFRSTCRKLPMSVQLWAGAATCLSTTSMVWLVNAVSRHAEHMTVLAIAFLFQAGLALLGGSVLIFIQQIRQHSRPETVRP